MKLITLLLSTLTATSLFVIPAHAGSYVSGSVGNGGIYGDGAVDDRGMKWKSFDVRFGKEVDPSSVFP
ncbi:MAG: hypothetical protein J7501_18530, partial [Bdellovibrio sp.]|nr:hypothetical protein [Bdellovibrio sp.]